MDSGIENLTAACTGVKYLVCEAEFWEISSKLRQSSDGVRASPTAVLQSKVFRSVGKEDLLNVHKSRVTLVLSLLYHPHFSH